VRTCVTKVGKLFLALMLMFYIASVTSQSGLLLLFIGLMGGCFVVNWSFARRSIRNLEVTAPQLVQLVEGESPRESWRVHNGSSKHAEGIDLLHGEGLMFRLPVVKLGETLCIVPKLVYDRRGVYPNAEVTLSSCAPYGLVRATRKLQLPGELVVLPRVYEAASPASAGLDFTSGGKFRGARRVNHGTHFAGVRPWQAGDSIKQVDWKSTARRGDLMVKTFDEELGGRLSLLLDCAPASTDAVDNAVRAAASLGVAALQEGHHLELHESSEAPLRLAPFSDEGELLLRLARFKPGADSACSLDLLWRRSTVAIVGTAWRESWRELLKAGVEQRRQILIYLPIGERLPADAACDLGHFDRAEIVEAKARAA
jgi:uncharacterized protein (DUF58 family)